MSSDVKVTINQSGVRSVLKSEECEAALLAACKQLEPKCEAQIRSHLHGPMSMALVESRVKRMRNCSIGVIHARAFRKGARHGGTGPAAAAVKYGMKP